MEAEELRQVEAQRVAELIAKQEQQRLERAHQEKMVCQACDFACQQCIALAMLLHCLKCCTWLMHVVLLQSVSCLKTQFIRNSIQTLS